MRASVLLGASVLALASSVLGCGGTPAPASDAATPPDEGLAAECTTASDCDDGLFCNGVESCVAGACVAGSVVRCDDGVACTLDTCSESMRRCVARVTDADGDGVGDLACVDGTGAALGSDCDDTDPLRFPGNTEICDADGHDEDCDPTTLGGIDADGDGEISSACCNGTSCGLDCGDGSASVRPGASEACNGLDDDCDGHTDEGVTIVVYPDLDHDGDGDASAAPMDACASTAATSVYHSDCDDADRARSGRAIEICDLVDNDCNDAIDDAAQEVVWYVDADHDGFGSATGDRVSSCAPVDGYSRFGTDCDDATSSRNPAQAELCNGIDDDCNGVADFRIAAGDLEDDDGDGVPDAACGGTDCNDRDASARAGASESCNGLDDDCDGRVDEQVVSVATYRDADGDGYGDSSGPTRVACLPSAGWVRRGGDCDDGQSARHPGALEGCDGVDDDCDGATDEGSAASSCSTPHTRSACIGGTCAHVGCDDGWRACSETSSACTTYVLEDRTSCGACGRACAASEYCAAGACVAGTRDLCNRFVGGSTGRTACPETSFVAVADATVTQASPDNVEGSDTSLYIVPPWFGQPERQILARFDLSTLPADAVVLGARLEAHAYNGWANGGDGTVYTHLVRDDSWNESTVSWNTAPAADATRLGGWWLWYARTPSDQLGTNQSPSLWPVVAGEAASDGLLSVRLESSGYETDYYARESGAATAMHLVVGTLPGTTITIPAIADGWVDATSTSHGTATTLAVGASSATYLRFDLGSIPAGAVIGRVTLTMTLADGAANGGDGIVHVAGVSDDAWTEATLAGTTAPAADVSDLGTWSITYPVTGQAIALRSSGLRERVVSERAADGMLSVRLAGSADSSLYRSRETPIAADRPRLTIVYAVP